MKVDYSQLDYLDDNLKMILMELENTLKVEFTNTSNFRPGDSGVHGHGRGWDLQCTYDAFGQFIEVFINSRWQYDPSRPDMKCCMYHRNRGSEGKHIHIQTHPNTRRRDA